MEKKCFVIMQTGDPDGYAQGHFNRVYQYVIVPACTLAGFRPVLADDPTSNETAWDIIKTIIESDIAICDLSAKNSNALYGFAIRQAINLPVILIRDMKTKIKADIQEFGEVVYDESLRIDTVQKEIETVSKALSETFANKVGTNSLLSRLGIGSAPLTETWNADRVTSTTGLIDQVENDKKESPLPIITPLPDFVGDPITEDEEIDKLRVGDFLFHINYGKGEIRAIKKSAKGKIATIHFGSVSKLLALMTSGVFRKIKA